MIRFLPRGLPMVARDMWRCASQWSSSVRGVLLLAAALAATVLVVGCGTSAPVASGSTAATSEPIPSTTPSPNPSPSLWGEYSPTWSTASSDWAEPRPTPGLRRPGRPGHARLEGRQTRHAEVSVAKAQIAWAVWSWRFIEKRQPVPSQFRKLNQLWYLTHEMTYTAGFYNGYSPKNPNGPVDAGKRTYYLWLSSKAYQALLKQRRPPASKPW